MRIRTALAVMMAASASLLIVLTGMNGFTMRAHAGNSEEAPQELAEFFQAWMEWKPGVLQKYIRQQVKYDDKPVFWQADNPDKNPYTTLTKTAVLEKLRTIRAHLVKHRATRERARITTNTERDKF